MSDLFGNAHAWFVVANVGIRQIAFISCIASILILWLIELYRLATTVAERDLLLAFEPPRRAFALRFVNGLFVLMVLSMALYAALEGQSLEAFAREFVGQGMDGSWGVFIWYGVVMFQFWSLDVRFTKQGIRVHREFYAWDKINGYTWTVSKKLQLKLPHHVMDLPVPTELRGTVDKILANYLQGKNQTIERLATEETLPKSAAAHLSP